MGGCPARASAWPCPFGRFCAKGGERTPPTIWQNGQSSLLYPCHGRGCVRATAKGSRVHRCKTLALPRAVRCQVGEGNMSRGADRERPNHAPTQGRPPRIVVRVTFETSFTAAACLAEAYEHLVPTLRRRLPQGNGQARGLPAEPLPRLHAGERERREGRR